MLGLVINKMNILTHRVMYRIMLHDPHYLYYCDEVETDFGASSLWVSSTLCLFNDVNVRVIISRWRLRHTNRTSGVERVLHSKCSLDPSLDVNDVIAKMLQSMSAANALYVRVVVFA